MYEKRKCGKVNFNNGTFYKRIFSQIGTVRADGGTESFYNEENDKTSKERLGEEIENKEKDLSNVKKEEVLEKEKKDNQNALSSINRDFDKILKK